MNRELSTNKDEHMLSRDEESISGLLAGLVHVDAPVNFERQVISKIAEGAPVRGAVFSIPALAYGISLVVILFIATVLIFKFRQPSIVQPESVAVSSNSVPVQQNNSVGQMPSVAPNEQPPAVAQSERPSTEPATISDPRKAGVSLTANSNVKSGGSYDEALPQKKNPLPGRIGQANALAGANSRDVVGSTPIAVKDLLSILGLSVDYSNGWKVSSVSKNSVAQRAGIEAGDVIVALDDKVLAASTQFQGSGTINQIQFRRDGIVKTVKIK